MIRLPKFSMAALVATLMLGLATPVFADLTSGTIRSVNNERKEIVLKGVLKDTTYALIKDAIVVLDGRRAQLKDLMPNDKVTLDIRKSGEQTFAHSARALRSASEASGTVRFVIADKNQLVLKGVVSDTVYHMDKTPTIWLNGKECNFSDLRENDSVTVTYFQSGDNRVVRDVRAERK